MSESTDCIGTTNHDPSVSVPKSLVETILCLLTPGSAAWRTLARIWMAVELANRPAKMAIDFVATLDILRYSRPVKRKYKETSHDDIEALVIAELRHQVEYMVRFDEDASRLYVKYGQLHNATKLSKGDQMKARTAIEAMFEQLRKDAARYGIGLS